MGMIGIVIDTSKTVCEGIIPIAGRCFQAHGLLIRKGKRGNVGGRDSEKDGGEAGEERERERARERERKRTRGTRPELGGREWRRYGARERERANGAERYEGNENKEGKRN